MGFASIGYVPEDGWYAGTEARYMGDIMADDENTGKSAVLYSRRLIHRV
ncbi:TonB-dependent receptor [Escherichia coli]|uniref:TonB-dependent receptor n=1 Tax=Escherichia coli TaxID=562 RepID=A0AAX2KAR9_ECOLX|nr:TonB-dependent receptor [Escherichia coli]